MTEAKDPVERRSLPLAKVATALVVVIAAIALLRMLPTEQWLEAVQVWVTGLGVLGWIVYAFVYAVCCVLFVPATILTLGAGAIFGLGKGTGIVVAGATMGATLSFLLARTVLRRRVESMTEGNARFRALDRAIAREGAKIVFLIRLAPIFPFTYINYAFGLTGVGTMAYALSTFLGIIPGTFAFVYLGYSGAQAATGSVDQTRLIINVAGAVLALVATIFVARVATRAIRRAGIEEKSEVSAEAGVERT